MALTVISEEFRCRFGNAQNSSSDPLPQDVDQVAMSIKHTFFELVLKPRKFQRMRSFTDSELLSADDETRLFEHSDASTSIPSDEEESSDDANPVEQQVEWESPNWGPAGDLFYSSSTPDDFVFALPPSHISEEYDWTAFSQQAAWGLQPWAMPCWPSAEQLEQWSMYTDLNVGTSMAASSGAVTGGQSSVADAGLAFPSEASEALKTTIMLRILPKQYTRSDMIQLLEDEGFEGSYDLVYVPMDFSCECCLGYAFVNFMTESDAARCWAAFEGFSEWGASDSDVCEVVWSSPHQGTEALIERYRNSPVMHDSVPDEWKPAYFVDGAQAPFPAPTNKIKAPKQKHTRGKGKKGNL